MKKCLIVFVSFLLSTLTVFAIAISGTVITPSSYYNDINSSHKYFEAIEYITKENIVNGYEDGTYKPDKLLNRAELLKILMEANYDDSDFAGYSAVSCFNDVPADQWFTKYICAAKAAGIVEGYSDDTFRPANKISLVEALKITLKTFGYDYGPSNPWYKSVVEEASERNFIPLDFVAFDNDVTRGQMADMITRMLLYVLQGNALSEYLDEKSSYKVTYQSLLTNDYVEGHIDFTGAIDNTSPGDVEEVNVTALDNGKVKVMWDAATDNVAVAGYVVHYGKTSVTKANEKYELSKDVGNVLQYTFSGLEGGKKYYFSVVAYDAAENESAYWAPEASVIVKIPVSSGSPSQVTNVDVTASDGEITLTWSAATDDEEVEGYKIYFDTKSIDEDDKDDAFWRNVGNSLEYIFDDLVQKEKYYFYVVAYDNDDNESSNWSAAVSATYELQLITDLAEKVCTNEDPSSSGTYQCTEAKKDLYSCDTVQRVDYYNYNFLRCAMTDVSADEVLVFEGGLLANGHNLIADKAGKVEVISNAAELLSFWDDINSQTSAKEFARAATGYMAISSGTDLNDVFGDNFSAEANVDVKYSVVTEASGKYQVPLYYKATFGCSPFSVYEKVYEVSNSGLSLKDQTKIGEVKNGLCVD